MTHAPEDLTPTAKLVWYILDELGEATAQEIAAASFVPRRTVNDALPELIEAGYVTQQPDVSNPNRPTYSTAREFRVTAEVKGT